MKFVNRAYSDLGKFILAAVGILLTLISLNGAFIFILPGVILLVMVSYQSGVEIDFEQKRLRDIS